MRLIVWLWRADSLGCFNPTFLERSIRQVREDWLDCLCVCDEFYLSLTGLLSRALLLGNLCLLSPWLPDLLFRMGERDFERRLKDLLGDLSRGPPPPPPPRYKIRGRSRINQEQMMLYDEFRWMGMRHVCRRERCYPSPLAGVGQVFFKTCPTQIHDFD